MKKYISLVGLSLIVGLTLVTSPISASDKTVTVTNSFTTRSQDKTDEGTKIEEKIQVPLNPKKVVVYDLGALDTITALGKKNQVVAIPKQESTLDMLDKDLKKIYKSNKYKDAGSLREPNFETIAALQPDVIIISGRTATAKNIQEFKKAAPKAVLIYGSISQDGTLVKATKDKVSLFGKIFDQEKKAKSYQKELDEKLKELQEKVTKKGNPKVLFVMANGGELLAQSPVGRFGWIFSEAGFEAVNNETDASPHGSPISFEYLTEKNPDYLFVLDRGATIGEKASANKILSNDVIKQTKAIKKNQVLQVNGKDWYINTGGINTTLDMIEEVSDLID